MLELPLFPTTAELRHKLHQPEAVVQLVCLLSAPPAVRTSTLYAPVARCVYTSEEGKQGPGAKVVGGKEQAAETTYGGRASAFLHPFEITIVRQNLTPHLRDYRLF